MAPSVLVICNDPHAVAAICEALFTLDEAPVMICVPSLFRGVARLRVGDIDAVLLDLGLPDSVGIHSFDEVLVAAGGVPVLVLTTQEEENTARQAILHGANARILKEQIDQHSLRHAFRHMLQSPEADRGLFMERERARTTLNSIADGVITTDRDGNVAYLNPVAERMTGWSRDEATGRTLREVFRIVGSDTGEPPGDRTQSMVRQDKIDGLTGSCVLFRRDGLEAPVEGSTAPIHDRDGCCTGSVMVFRDATEARLRELRLTRLAQHDLLTGLPNRALLKDRIEQAIAFAQRQGKAVAVLFLDIDRFKDINDSLGHAVGDKLLQEFAKRLAAAIRGSDTVSRHGGDEFVVVLTGIEHVQDVARRAEKIHVALSAPQAVAEHVPSSVSIGISIFPGDGHDAESLIQRADTAMYKAKASGRNTYRFFRPEMTCHTLGRQSAETGCAVRSTATGAQCVTDPESPSRPTS